MHVPRKHRGKSTEELASQARSPALCNAGMKPSMKCLLLRRTLLLYRLLLNRLWRPRLRLRLRLLPLLLRCLLRWLLLLLLSLLMLPRRRLRLTLLWLRLLLFLLLLLRLVTAWAEAAALQEVLPAVRRMGAASPHAPLRAAPSSPAHAAGAAGACHLPCGTVPQAADLHAVVRSDTVMEKIESKIASGSCNIIS